MRRGQQLGAELYTSQPPVFYWLLRALAAPFGSSMPDIRVAFALLAIVGVAAAIALGWRLYGPPAGVAAGALVAIGPPYPSVAPTVSADVPAVAFGLVSLALVAFALRSGAPRLGWRRRRRPRAGSADEAPGDPVRRPVPRAHARCEGRATGASRSHSSAQPRGADRRRRQCRRAGRHLAPGRDRPHRREKPRNPLGKRRPDPQASRASDSVRLARAAGLPAFVLSRRAPDLAAVDVRARRSRIPRSCARSPITTWCCSPSRVRSRRDPASRSRSAGCVGPREPPRHGSRALRRCRDVPGAATPAPERQRRTARGDVGDRGDRTHNGRRRLVVTDQPIVLFRARRATTGPLVDISNTRVTGGTLTAADVNAEIRRSRPTPCSSTACCDSSRRSSPGSTATTAGASAAARRRCTSSSRAPTPRARFSPDADRRVRTGQRARGSSAASRDTRSSSSAMRWRARRSRRSASRSPSSSAGARGG